MKMPSLWRVLALTCALLAVEAQADTQNLILSKDLQATPPSACLSREKAELEAGGLALKSAQAYCRSEGFGWRAAVVNNFGNLDCQRCGGSQFSCGYANVNLECRKAEPGLAWLKWFSVSPQATAFATVAAKK